MRIWTIEKEVQKEGRRQYRVQKRKGRGIKGRKKGAQSMEKKEQKRIGKGRARARCYYTPTQQKTNNNNKKIMEKEYECSEEEKEKYERRKGEKRKNMKRTKGKIGKENEKWKRKEGD